MPPSSVLQCSTLCCILPSALLGRVGSSMVQHLSTAAKRFCYSRSCCFLALFCGTRAGRQCFHYTALEIYRSFRNSGWLLLLLSWKQTAKNGACSFKLSKPSNSSPFLQSWKECDWYFAGGRRAEITLVMAELQKDMHIVPLGEKAVGKADSGISAGSALEQAPNKQTQQCTCLMSKRSESYNIWFPPIMRLFMWRRLIYIAPRNRMLIFLALGIIKSQHSCVILEAQWRCLTVGSK